jgi:hypothetical protein
MTPPTNNDPIYKTISLDGLKAHEYADIFPMSRKDSVGFLALVEDIKASGLKERVTIYKGEILDGRNRVEALKILGTKEIKEYCEFNEYTGDDPLGFVLSLNLHRRHLTTSQRAAIAATLTNLKLGDNQHSGEGVSIDKASKLLNVSRISVARARAVLEKKPELLKEVEKGATTLNAAQQQMNSEDQPQAPEQGGAPPPPQGTPATPPKKEKATGAKPKKPKNQTVINEDVQPNHANYKTRLELMIEALREWPKGNLSLAEEWANEARQRIDDTIEQLVGEEGEQLQAAE